MAFVASSNSQSGESKVNRAVNAPKAISCGESLEDAFNSLNLGTTRSKPSDTEKSEPLKPSPDEKEPASSDKLPDSTISTHVAKHTRHPDEFAPASGKSSTQSSTRVSKDKSGRSSSHNVDLFDGYGAYPTQPAFVLNQSPTSYDRDVFDDCGIFMSASPDNAFATFNSGVERSSMQMIFDQYQQQQPNVQHQYFSFPPNPAPPTLLIPPTNTHRSLLSQQLKALYPQEFTNTPVVTSPSANAFGFSHSMDHVTTSSMYRHFASPPMNMNELGQYQTPSQKVGADYDIALLTPTDTPISDWKMETKSIPILKPHGRNPSFSASNRPHPYRQSSSSLSTDMDMMSSRSPAASISMESVLAQSTPLQQTAIQHILSYIQAHPHSAIPSTLITPELAEVQDGRGYCLIGNCGLDRAAQKTNPLHDPVKDTTRKRLDHLYDHIRHKHFDYRPYKCLQLPCTQAFSYEHDLKRHEKTHQSVFLPCNICGKNYTREDNLKRHIQIKHASPLPAVAL